MRLDNSRTGTPCVYPGLLTARQPAWEKQILPKSLPMKFVILLDLDTNIDLQLLF